MTFTIQMMEAALEANGWRIAWIDGWWAAPGVSIDAGGIPTVDAFKVLLRQKNII